MKKSLTKRQVENLKRFSVRLSNFANRFEDDSNVALNYGNGSVREQLDIALAAIETILQEYYNRIS